MVLHKRAKSLVVELRVIVALIGGIETINDVLGSKDVLRCFDYIGLITLAQRLFSK